MARDGYLVPDSDLHMMEFGDLWVRYRDAPHNANPSAYLGSRQTRLEKSKEDKGNPDLLPKA